MKVRAYRNLNKSCWSVVEKSSGRVMFHTDELALQDCTFVVSESGRQRVLREQRKNVHAFVEGQLTSKQSWRTSGAAEAMRVLYNPYKADTFKWENLEGDSSAINAPLCWLGDDGRLYAIPN